MFRLKYLFCRPFDSAAVATALQFNPLAPEFYI